MPTFAYKARDGSGKLVKGTLEAVTKDELAEKLRRMGYMATGITETLPGVERFLTFDGFRGIGSEEMAMFNFQLSNLIHSGMSLLASLSTLNEQLENHRLKQIMGDLSRTVEAGESFSEALEKHPRVFSPLFVSMVKAGEASGRLDTILSRFAVYTEQQADLKQKIKGALFYPVILLAAGIAVTLAIVTFLIPQFAEIFMKVGIQLPLPTRILYVFGTAIKSYWFLFLAFLALSGVGIRLYVRTSRGRLQIDRLKLRLPLFGPIYRKSAISRFARTLAMLVSAGVPILQSLDIVKEVIGNEVLARVIGNLRIAVEKGERVAEPLKLSGEFPPDTIQMIAAGEETGSLDEMLDKVSDFYDRSVSYSLKKLTTVLEPLLLAIMGCLVGFIMASLLLPMFDMMKFLRHARPGF